MGLKVVPLILAIFIVFQCHEGYCEKNVLRVIKGPPKIEKGSKPVAKGGYMIQQITTQIDYVGTLHYDYYNKELLFVDKIKNGSVYFWSDARGNTRKYYYKELSEETLASITSIDNHKNQFMIGSDLNLRLLTQNKLEYFFSDPLVTFNETGFTIFTAKCDDKSRLLILLIGTTEENENLGRMYILANKQVTFLKEFSDKPRDFQFNMAYDKLYMIHENGTVIKAHAYDKKTVTIGDSEKVFSKNEFSSLDGHVLKGIAVDRTPGNLWVAAAGRDGFVLQINPNKKTLLSTTLVPNKNLTFICHGYSAYKNLFVGSRSTYVQGPAQGNIYAISGMGNQGVPDRTMRWYS